MARRRGNQCYADGAGFKPASVLMCRRASARKIEYPTREYQPTDAKRRNLSTTGDTTVFGIGPKPGAVENALASASAPIK
jgi:hypothetical protein